MECAFILPVITELDKLRGRTAGFTKKLGGRASGVAGRWIQFAQSSPPPPTPITIRLYLFDALPCVADLYHLRIKLTIFVYLMMVLIHICTQPQEHSQPLIFLCVLRTFLWRLILWLNRIHTVVIILLLFKKIVFAS